MLRKVLDEFGQPESVLPTKIRRFLDRFDELETERID
jgi:hypothetical protein